MIPTIDDLDHGTAARQLRLEVSEEEIEIVREPCRPGLSVDAEVGS